MRYSIKKKTMIWIVYDSLGNYIAKYYNKIDALNHKSIFGNLGWYIKYKKFGY